MSGVTAGQMTFYLKTFVNDRRDIKAAVRAVCYNAAVLAHAQWIAL
jgi:hypothetical protein